MAGLLLACEVESIRKQAVVGITAAQDARISVSKSKQVRPDCKSEWLLLKPGRSL